MAVRVLAVAGWAIFGPRPRVELRDVRLAMVWPLLWTVETLVVGGLTGWYPYPFLDHREEHGVPGVVLAVAGILVLVLLVFAMVRLVDQRARPAPEAHDPYRGGVVRP